MPQLLILFILPLAFLISACSTPAPDTSARPGGPVIATDPNIETVVILGTNDIHGALPPMQLKTKDDGTSYERGGAAYLASYLRILKAEYGDRLLLLDGGDEFQGSIESNSEKGAPMVQFLNTVGITAAAIGNHEFDFKQDALRLRMAEAKYPYLAANITDKSTGKRPDYPNFMPSMLVQTGRVKVGIIGLSTRETPVTTIPENVRGLEFTDLAAATQREAKSLRAKGAQVVVIVGHVGQSCDISPSTKNQIRKEGDTVGDCDKSDEVYQLLSSIPRGTVDAMVSGHSHTIVHHWINGVPVIQSGSRGHQFHLLYLEYNVATKKVLADQTRIEGPVPVCPRIFRNQGDCNGDRPAPKNGRGSLVKPQFRGQDIAEDPTVALLLTPVFERAQRLKEKVVGEAARKVEHARTTESELGNAVTDAIRESVKADVAIMNAGGIRAPIERGPITYGEVFQTLPFENVVSILTVSGKELRSILRVAESGARGFFPTSGLRLKIIGPQYEASGTDLDNSKKIEPWEIDRLVEVRLEDGTPLSDKKMYKLAIVDFLVMGGDDFDWVMSQIPKSRIQLTASAAIRDVMIDYLAKHSPLNSETKPLVKPADPRITFVAPPPPKKRVRRAKVGKRRR